MTGEFLANCEMHLSDGALEINQNGQNGIAELIKSARNSCAVASPHDPPPIPLPHWIDPKLIQAGKDFVRRHFFMIFFTHFISLILLLSYLPVKRLLLKTKRSHTKNLALTRYLSTLRHVMLWYEDDLTAGDSRATKDVIKIRKIHSGIYQRFQDNPSPVDCQLPKMEENGKGSTILAALHKCGKSTDENNNPITKLEEASPFVISQLDLIVTQYCFMGLLTSLPEKFGISPSSAQDMEGLKGFSHIWAVIGHHLGIEERFNLCIGERSELREYILEEILLPEFFTSDGKALALWEALVSGMSVFVPCLSLRAALLYVLEFLLERGQEETSGFYEDAKFYDLFCFRLTVILMNNLFQIGVVSNFFNSLLRLAIHTTHVWLEGEKKFKSFMSSFK